MVLVVYIIAKAIASENNMPAIVDITSLFTRLSFSETLYISIPMLKEEKFI
jgi:hypothetical protein